MEDNDASRRKVGGTDRDAQTRYCPRCGTRITQIDTRGPHTHHLAPCGHQVDQVDDLPRERPVACDGGIDLTDRENWSVEIEDDRLQLSLGDAVEISVQAVVDGDRVTDLRPIHEPEGTLAAGSDGHGRGVELYPTLRVEDGDEGAVTESEVRDD